VHFDEQVHFLNRELGIQDLFLYNSQPSKPFSSFATLNGDVLYNYYHLNESDTIADYIHLLSYDESTGEVKGRFQASYVLDSAEQLDPDFLDTVVIIKDGYFETKIYE
jgi:hypothetical protein